ncbi:MAG: cell division protein ZapB [Spirochaetaceae bacterium]|jgi:chromosome segregation ATPase|nr:cell division protein ZapB [Spirochaetaceae bacterium]
MVTIEQVRQLETRVAKAIDYVNAVTGENTLLKAKLESYQKRIDELEVLIQRFKEEQARIEEGIIAALDRLNRFEDDMRKTIGGQTDAPPPALEPLSDEAFDTQPPRQSAETDGQNADDAAPRSYAENMSAQARQATENSDDLNTDDGTEPGSELDIF